MVLVGWRQQTKYWRPQTTHFDCLLGVDGEKSRSIVKNCMVRKAKYFLTRGHWVGIVVLALWFVPQLFQFVQFFHPLYHAT